MESETDRRRRYPRLIGLAPQLNGGPPQRWYELLVTGRDKLGGLAELTAAVARRNANLAPSGGYYLVSPGTFVWTSFVSFANSRSSMDSLLGDIRHLSFVASVEAVEVKGAAIDQFLFPVMITPKHRGVVMSLEAAEKAEMRLENMLGTSGAVLMYEEGKAYGKEVFAEALQDLPRQSPQELLRTTADVLRATGWGVFEWDASKLEREGTISVSIEESPYATTKHESHFLNGALAGVVGSILGREMSIASAIYDEPSRTMRLSLRTQK